MKIIKKFVRHPTPTPIFLLLTINVQLIGKISIVDEIILGL